MTLYYRGRGARITHEVIELYGAQPRTLAIHELEYVHVVREPVVVRVIGAPPVTVCSAALAGAAVVTATGTLSHPVIAAAAVALATGASSLLAVGLRLHSRPRSIWAIHRDRLVCLYSTGDRLEFGQVCRALLRALENR